MLYHKFQLRSANAVTGVESTNAKTAISEGSSEVLHFLSP
jgi:hypothetical protein